MSDEIKNRFESWDGFAKPEPEPKPEPQPEPEPQPSRTFVTEAQMKKAAWLYHKTQRVSLTVAMERLTTNSELCLEWVKLTEKR